MATYIWEGEAVDSGPSAPISRATRELGLGKRGNLPGVYASTRAGMHDRRSLVSAELLADVDDWQLAAEIDFHSDLASDVQRSVRA